MRMTQVDDIAARLRSHEAELRARGVLHLGIFGSVARGEERPDSDLDLLVAIDPQARVGLLQFVALGRHIEELVGRAVDLAEYDVLKPALRAEAFRDEVRVF
ncbi:MAG: nucleotidyltransferase domain-containing protein [Gemmataceae bacterium]|nr:nucleotidyltransferase domain-containing protein [Gemmataceae bacterium]